MRLATYRHRDGVGVGVGVVMDGAIAPLQSGSMLDVIGSGERPRHGGDRIPLPEVRLLAPIPRPPRNVFCVGSNYRAHAVELERIGLDDAPAPIVFTKPPETVIGDGEPVGWPRAVTECLDYEAELAVVIGRDGRRITRELAYRHVFGYTIVTDITARDLQRRHGQWFLGKALDTSCPMGPWIVTSDELDPRDLRIRCWVGKELRQDASTRDLIADIPTLIETISAGTTLRAGDVIATGTLAGVGIGFDPPRFLAEGDRIQIEISGIGSLANTVVAG